MWWVQHEWGIFRSVIHQHKDLEQETDAIRLPDKVDLDAVTPNQTGLEIQDGGDRPRDPGSQGESLLLFHRSRLPVQRSREEGWKIQTTWESRKCRKALRSVSQLLSCIVTVFLPLLCLAPAGLVKHWHSDDCPNNQSSVQTCLGTELWAYPFCLNDEESMVKEMSICWLEHSRLLCSVLSSGLGLQQSHMTPI